MILASGGIFAEGMSFSWSSPIEAQIVQNSNGTCTHTFCISATEFAWVATCLSIGAMASVYIAGYLMSTFGRKPTMIGYTVILLAGWSFLSFASSSWMLHLGRVFVGIGCGGSGACIPLYVGEIAQTSVRGRILSIIEMNMQLGIVATYIFGYFFPIFLQNVISLGILVVYGFALLLIPESPFFFVS